MRPGNEDGSARWPWVFLALLAVAVGAWFLWPPSENAPITVYKWRDSDGAWHFADHAPPGVEAEAVQVQPGTVMPEPPPPTAPEAGGEGSTLGHLPKSLIDRAHQAGERLEEQGRSMTEGLDRAGEP